MNPVPPSILAIMCGVGNDRWRSDSCWLLLRISLPTSDLTLSTTDYFSQVDKSLDRGSSDPEAFQLLLRHLAEHLDTGDGQASFMRLQNFGVPDGTPFSDYLRSFRLLFSSVTGSERVLAPSVSMVVELVRQSVKRQYPTMSPPLITLVN